MTKQEIQKKIDELENRIFIHEMKDRWNERDWEIHYQQKAELKALRKML